MGKIFISHHQAGEAAASVAALILCHWQHERPPVIYPVPRGGVPAAYLVGGIMKCLITNDITQADVIIDDLVDSGATFARAQQQNNHAIHAALFGKEGTQQLGPEVLVGEVLPNKWLVFPWEEGEAGSAEDIGIRLLQYIGEDPNREGLLETPARMLKAWKEWTAGYKVDTSLLFKDFGDGAENYDEMVIVDPIPFYSHCEHHLAAIFGSIHIAYIPNGRIAGLSKFVRLAHAYARRLQVQERLTVQIADDINKYLEPLGVGVMVRARHFCMESRGSKSPGTETTTIALRGALKEDQAARAEFISLVKGR